MKRVWLTFFTIYAVVIAITGIPLAYSSLVNHSLENMRWWFALVLEGGILLSPLVFVVAYVVTIIWNLFSKNPQSDSVPDIFKRILFACGFLFFFVLPPLLLRNSMFLGAARNGSIGRARILLALGADINARESYGGNGALTWAIIYGHQDMVEFLVNNKIEFNTNNILDMVPRGHEQIADVLKKYGAVETGKRDNRDAINCTLSRDKHKYAK